MALGFQIIIWKIYLFFFFFCFVGKEAFFLAKLCVVKFWVKVTFSEKILFFSKSMMIIFFIQIYIIVLPTQQVFPKKWWNVCYWSPLTAEGEICKNMPYKLFQKWVIIEQKNITGKMLLNIYNFNIFKKKSFLENYAIHNVSMR